MIDNKYDALKLENQLCFPLYAAAREGVKKYRPFLDELGITYTQYVTMIALWEHDKLSVKELGKRLHLDSGTLTPVLKSLEAKGYIDRQRSSEDERVLIAELTPAGKALRDKALDIPKEVASFVKLSSRETAQLRSLLCKLIAADEG